MYTSSRQAMLKPFFEIYTFDLLHEGPDIMHDEPHMERMAVMPD